MSVGIKNSGVLENLSVALVVDAQPIGWSGFSHVQLGRAKTPRGEEKSAVSGIGFGGLIVFGNAWIVGEPVEVKCDCQ